MNPFDMIQQDIIEEELRRDGPQVAAAKRFRKTLDGDTKLTTPEKERLYRLRLKEIWDRG